MSAEKQQAKTAIERADEELLASLGYKQEFRRAFTGLEVRSIVFRSIGAESSSLDVWNSFQHHRLTALHRVSVLIPSHQCSL